MNILRYFFGTLWVIFVWLMVAVIVGLGFVMVFPPHDNQVVVGVGLDWRNLPGTILGFFAARQSWRKHVSRKPKNRKLFAPAVKAYNPEHSFVVSGVSKRRLCSYLSTLSGIVFTRKPRLIGSGAYPHAEFTFRSVDFKMDDGGDMGGDGLWFMAKDKLPHPAELRELRDHIEKSIAQNEHDA